MALTRRALLVASGAGLTALAAERLAWALPLPPVPLSFAVATDDGKPVRDGAWLDDQVAQMEALFGPLGVHPTKVAVRSIETRYADMVSRADRDALYAELRPGVANVFIVKTLMDVDEPPRMRRGVHWRSRVHATARYVIVASEAPLTVLAHEMGHYFGNGHSKVVDNLMSYERTGGPVFLDGAQARVIQESARAAFASGELVATRSGGG